MVHFKKNTGIILTLSFVGFSTLNAYAISATEKSQLEKLDPHTRLEQRCDIEAMNRLAKETKYSPDKVLAYSFGDPKVGKNRVQANGAAFRARGQWYHLSYDCQTADDQMTIQHFKYKTGAIIPKSSWDKHYLVP